MKNTQILFPVGILSLTALSACTIPGMSQTDIQTPAPIVASGTSLSAEATPSSNILSGSTDTGGVTRTEKLSYDSKTPDGMVEIEFSVSVKDGIITAASAIPKTDKQGSLYNQESFAKELSAKVAGKKAKDLDVDAIGGASLTTDAFETFVHSF